MPFRSKGKKPTRQFKARCQTGSGGSTQVKGIWQFYRLDGDNDTALCQFVVPHDFQNLHSAVVLCYVDVTASGKNIDLNTEYGADGEAENNHTESDTTSTYNFTQAKWQTIDVSGVLSGIAAGDRVALKVTLKEAYNLYIPWDPMIIIRYN